jgi:hypothetical protein
MWLVDRNFVSGILRALLHFDISNCTQNVIRRSDAAVQIVSYESGSDAENIFCSKKDVVNLEKKKIL